MAEHCDDSAEGAAVGKPSARAPIVFGLITGAIIGTTLHELGHNLELYHGGNPPQWIPDPMKNTGVTYREPQCQPNHLSIMSYIFQIPGLLDDAGVAQYEYSSEESVSLDETFIADGYPSQPLRTNRRTAWFAPWSCHFPRRRASDGMVHPAA